jgi:hypothetical protein
MSSYWKIRIPSSDCVHFVYGDEVDQADPSIIKELDAQRVRRIYLDYDKIKSGKEHIANAIAYALNLQHAPYRLPTKSTEIDVWVPFLDDLISLSQHEAGVVIVIDRADVLLTSDSKVMFRLIEAFLVQFHHWFEKKKPCHLCFQMEKNELVREIFASDERKQ